MVYSNNNSLVNKIIKPTSNVNLIPLTSIALAGAGTEVITNENNDGSIAHTVTIPKNQEKLNLWQFLHLYTIGGIPIIDFFIFYVILYIVNALYLHCDYKLILLLTVPIAIVYNILTNKNLKISLFIVLASLISIYFLLTMNFENK
jgi:hypothetical protein